MSILLGIVMVWIGLAYIEITRFSAILTISGVVILLRPIYKMFEGDDYSTLWNRDNLSGDNLDISFGHGRLRYDIIKILEKNKNIIFEKLTPDIFWEIFNVWVTSNESIIEYINLIDYSQISHAAFIDLLLNP